MRAKDKRKASRRMEKVNLTLDWKVCSMKEAPVIRLILVGHRLVWVNKRLRRMKDKDQHIILLVWELCQVVAEMLILNHQLHITTQNLKTLNYSSMAPPTLQNVGKRPEVSTVHKVPSPQLQLLDVLIVEVQADMAQQDHQTTIVPHLCLKLIKIR